MAATDSGSLIAARDPYPQEQKIDRATVQRWRREAITAPAQDRLWLNRCEALCNAWLAASARSHPLAEWGVEDGE